MVEVDVLWVKGEVRAHRIAEGGRRVRRGLLKSRHVSDGEEGEFCLRVAG